MNPFTILVVLILNGNPDTSTNRDYWLTVSPSPLNCQLDAKTINAYSDAMMAEPTPAGVIQRQYVAWCEKPLR